MLCKHQVWLDNYSVSTGGAYFIFGLFLFGPDSCVEIMLFSLNDSPIQAAILILK